MKPPSEFRRRYSLFYMARHRAKTNKLDFTITLEWLNRVWPLDGKCPVLGLDLKWAEYKSGLSPSIDKIVPTGGYTPDNCRVISWRANRLKSDATPDELQLLAADARRFTQRIHDSAD